MCIANPYPANERGTGRGPRERIPQADADVVGQRHRAIGVGTGAHGEHGERGHLVDLAGDRPEMAFRDRRPAPRSAGVGRLQAVDVEGDLGRDQRVEEAARQDGVVAHVHDEVGVGVDRIGRSRVGPPVLVDREPGARAELGQEPGWRPRALRGIGSDDAHPRRGNRHELDRPRGGAEIVDHQMLVEMDALVRRVEARRRAPGSGTSS